MKICIFTNHFYPEDFKVNDIAFELAKEGYDITVLTAIPDYPKGKFYVGYSLFKRRRENINGVYVIRLPIIPRGKGGAIRLVLNYVSYFLCLSVFTFFHSFRYKYDRIFVHLTSPFFIGVCARRMAKRQRIPLLFWVLDLWPESLISAGGISNPLIIKPQIKMVRKVYEQCDKILISSKGFETSICEKGDFKDKLVYFPNWAEEVKGKAPENFDIRTIKPFDEDCNFIILFAGNIGEAQNLEAAIEAAKILREEKKIKFVFVGDGRRREYLQNLVKEYALEETVFFPGRYPIETMPVFMNEASVLLFSLKDEMCFNLTVPAKVQFYMSQGKPILAMINGDGAELVKEAECGMAVAAGDAEDLAEVIKIMARKDKNALATFGNNGKIFYKKYFRKEQRIEQLEMLLSNNEFLENKKNIVKEYTVFIDETKNEKTGSQSFCAVAIENSKLDKYRQIIKEKRLMLIGDPAYSEPYTGERNQKALKKSFHTTELHPDTRKDFFDIIRYFEYEAFIYVYDNITSIENTRNTFLRNLYIFLQQRYHKFEINFIWEKDESLDVKYLSNLPIAEVAKENDELLAIADFVLFLFARGYYQNYTSNNEYQKKQDQNYYKMINEKIRFIKLDTITKPYTHDYPLELWK